MVTYSTNGMGPMLVGQLTTRGLEEGEQYCCGRIDVRDDSKIGYAGWSEYSLPPMKEESWGKLSSFLDNFTTKEVVGYFRLIEIFEQTTRHKIQWYKEK